MKNKLSVVLVLVLTFAVAGCANTIRGVGKDVSNTADAVADSVNDVAN